MKSSGILLGLLAIWGCQGDETVRAYGGAERTWTLKEINSTDFESIATLTFPEEGRIAGRAPCNSYSGEMRVPYPWFDAEALAVTRRACPDLADEGAFFDALRAASQSEVAGDTLILSNIDGLQMVFTADD